MLILSRVCAEFRNKAGQTIFTIGPRDLHSFLEAPEEIREDPMFAWMMADGSLEAARSVKERKALEADPVADTTAEGKKSKAKAPRTDSSATEVAPDVEAANETFATSPESAEKANDPVEAPAEATPAKGRKAKA